MITIVIPTYRRGEILLDTIRYLLDLPEPPQEILVVDQTEQPSPEVESFFQGLDKETVRRIMLPKPSIPHAMNVGLQEAKGKIILFLDDDIIPDTNLVSSHWKAHADFPEAAAVVGQVLQPEEEFQELGVRDQRSETRGQKTEDRGLRTEPGNQEQETKNQNPDLRRDLGFKFNSTQSCWVENVMAGNLSVKKKCALRVGGFDENFIPPVSFRFETEFAKRLIASGGKIRFEPAASIRHLRAGQGGTRSRGSHLTSAKPIHGVGDYYYALCHGQGWSRFLYMAIRPFRQIRTKFHLVHPWYIPVKLLGELRAITLAFRLNRNGPKRLATTRRVVLLSTTQSDRPDGSLVRYGAMVREALEAHSDCAVQELNLSPTQAWLDHFPAALQTPLRYFCIAWNARRLLPKQRGAVLHLLDGSHAYLFSRVPALRCPLAITVHDLIPYLCMTGELQGERPGRWARWILQQAVANLKRADWIAAVSENTQQDVCRIAKVTAEYTGVVHSSVSVPLDPGPEQSENTPYILHVAGNNNFYKNRPGVVEIFKTIRQSVPVRLKLAGAPPNAALQKQIDTSGVAADIEFCTHVSEEELAGLYRNAAFLLFPSFYEGFGWPPLEAMALGCPVLCSNAGSLAEITGDAAFIASPNDANTFAEYGIRLLNDPEERASRIEAGLQHVQNFNLKQLAAGLMVACQSAEKNFANES